MAPEELVFTIINSKCLVVTLLIPITILTHWLFYLFFSYAPQESWIHVIKGLMFFIGMPMTNFATVALLSARRRIWCDEAGGTPTLRSCYYVYGLTFPDMRIPIRSSNITTSIQKTLCSLYSLTFVCTTTSGADRHDESMTIAMGWSHSALTGIESQLMQITSHGHAAGIRRMDV